MARAIEIVVFPDANHLFQAAETGAVAEYSTLARRSRPDFLPTLVDWVTAQAGLAGWPMTDRDRAGPEPARLLLAPGARAHRRP